MFSCQFCEIFKSTFFIEHLWWLLLPILKPLDSQRQLCKRISKLVTIYLISTFLVLVGIFVFIWASTGFPFTSRRPCAWINMTFFIFHVTTQSKCHVSPPGGFPSSWFSTLPSFGGLGPYECGDKTFLTWHVTTWSMCLWLCWWGPSS